MASTAPISLSTALVDAKAASRQAPTPKGANANVTFLRPLTPRRAARASAYCPMLSSLHSFINSDFSSPLGKRNVAAMATGSGAQADVSADDVPEFVKTAQEAWENLEDKYAVSSLAVAGVVALWGSTGLVSAIDRLPLIPGVLELVGIGYSGWFAYRNLLFKPDREALIRKIKGTYDDIIGSS